MICMSYVSACDMRMWYVCVHTLHHDHCKIVFWKKDCKRKDIDLATHEGWNKCMWHVCMRTHCIMRIVKKNKKWNAGDIYLDTYEGWYNVKEETFITENEAQLTDYKDPSSGTHTLYRDTWYIQGHMLYAGTHTIYRYTGIYRDTYSL
jgi:hypothetical protein